MNTHDWIELSGVIGALLLWAAKKFVDSRASFRPETMTVRDIQSLSGQIAPYVTKEIVKELNGRYMGEIEKRITDSRTAIEKKISSGHEKLREDVRHDFRGITTCVVDAIEKIDPQAAAQLERDLRKTNPPE